MFCVLFCGKKAFLRRWVTASAIVSSLFWSVSIFGLKAHAEAQNLPTPPGSESPLHAVPPSSPLEISLHPALLPLEAEVSCGFNVDCTLGLTRGFAVGGDFLRSLGVTTLGQHFLDAGAWTYLDLNAGYQFLRRGERQSSFNLVGGYRSFGFGNSDNARLSKSGITIRSSYAESVSPAYTQGLIFEIHSSTLRAEGGAEKPFEKSDPSKARSLLTQFATFSRSHPAVRLRLPADLEVVNWKGADLNMEAPVRGFLRVTPLYEQTDLTFKNVQETVYSWVEKRFGLELMLLAAYAAPTEKSGRYAFSAGFGIESGLSRAKVDSNLPPGSVLPEIPTADVVRGKLEIQGTYQF
ncbi:MAG: hypothetical protein RIR26_1524 [Pseudomonadota bacterium]